MNTASKKPLLTLSRRSKMMRVSSFAIGCTSHWDPNLHQISAVGHVDRNKENSISSTNGPHNSGQCWTWGLFLLEWGFFNFSPVSLLLGSSMGHTRCTNKQQKQEHHHSLPPPPQKNRTTHNTQQIPKKKQQTNTNNKQQTTDNRQQKTTQRQQQQQAVYPKSAPVCESPVYDGP